MDTQFLFAYGTLKSDQPEHTQHCVKPLSISGAKVAGSLWQLREGYPILQIDPEITLLDATKDIVSDWENATDKATNGPPPYKVDQWITGELFEYPINEQVIRKMDTWENFVPGIMSTYQRRAVWLRDDADKDRIAWAYVCYSPPNWATLLSETSWNQ